MASKKSRLKVTRSPIAINELDSIWQWNAKQYDVTHADKYLAFLTDHIEALADNYARGKIVRSRPELRYLLIRRRPSGHGHIAVYSFDADEVYILHVFHSAQDWQGRVARESK
jgi:plasmid stabilization system protein ParE